MSKIKRLTSVFLVLIMLFCTVTAISCGTSVTYTVNVKAQDGSPISGIKVQFYLKGEQEQIDEGSTSAKGVASFEAKKRSGYYATVTVPDGYKPNPIKYGFGDGTSVDIIMAKKPADVLKLTYTVTVKDTEGAPISGATLKLFSGDTELDNAVTDANGIVTFFAVEGSYTVKVTSPAGYKADDKIYSFDAANNAVIDLEKQDEQPSNVSYTVKVKASDGTPLAGVLVTLKSGDTALQNIRTDADGNAVFSQPIGSYTVLVSAPEGYTASATGYTFDDERTTLISLATRVSANGFAGNGTEALPFTVGSSGDYTEHHIGGDSYLWFSYELPENGTLKVTVSSGMALWFDDEKCSETTASLYGASGMNVVFGIANADYSAGDVSFKLEFTPNAYHIVDTFENGDGTYDTPYELKVASTYTVTYAGGDTYVYFTYTLPSNGTLTVEILSPEGDAALWLDGDAADGASASCTAYEGAEIVFGVATDSYTASDITFRITFSSSQL